MEDNFKNLTEFQDDLDDFYESNEEDEKQKEVQPILQEQLHEPGIVFETANDFCQKCNTVTAHEVFTVRHKEERVCSRCRTKTEKRT